MKYMINKKRGIAGISLGIIFLVIIISQYLERRNIDNRPFIIYHTMEQIQDHLDEKLLMPTYIPTHIQYNKAVGNEQHLSIDYKNFKREKQVGYTIKLSNYPFNDRAKYEGEFNDLAINCLLKEASNTSPLQGNKLEEEISYIQDIAIHKVLLEREGLNDRKIYSYLITFEKGNYSYTICSDIFGYYTDEVLQRVKMELIQVTKSMLS